MNVWLLSFSMTKEKLYFLPISISWLVFFPSPRFICYFLANRLLLDCIVLLMPFCICFQSVLRVCQEAGTICHWWSPTCMQKALVSVIFKQVGEGHHLKCWRATASPCRQYWLDQCSNLHEGSFICPHILKDLLFVIACNPLTSE